MCPGYVAGFAAKSNNIASLDALAVAHTELAQVRVKRYSPVIVPELEVTPETPAPQIRKALDSSRRRSKNFRAYGNSYIYARCLPVVVIPA